MGFRKPRSTRWASCGWPRGAARRRKHLDEPVEREKVDLVLEAARLAPAAASCRPFRVHALRGGAARAKAATACRCAFGAPAIFLACSGGRRAWKGQAEPGYSAGEVDAPIACARMMLEAQALGLGSCWVRLFSVADVQRAFGLPRYIVPRCMLPVGCAHPDGGPYRPWHDACRPMDELAVVS